MPLICLQSGEENIPRVFSRPWIRAAVTLNLFLPLSGSYFSANASTHALSTAPRSSHHDRYTPTYLCYLLATGLKLVANISPFSVFFCLLCIFWPVMVVLFLTVSKITFCGIKPWVQQLCRVWGGFGSQQPKDPREGGAQGAVLGLRPGTVSPLQSSMSASLELQHVQSVISFQSWEKEISGSGVTLPHFWLFHCSLNPYSQFSSSASFCACLCYIMR